MNAINNYLRLKIRVVCVVIFIPKYLSIEFVKPNLSQIYLYIPEIFNPAFITKSPFEFVDDPEKHDLK